MQTTSALWKQYQTELHREYQYRVVIGTDEYLNQDIYSMSAEAKLCDDKIFTIGNVFSRKLNLVIKPKATAIPRMANVDVFVRMAGPGGPTEWLPQGRFLIDTRKKTGNQLVLECFDRVLLMEAQFRLEGVQYDYPMPMLDAINIICQRIGITFVNPATIQAGFMIEFPNELSMREVLANIAQANAGNFILNESGNLRLVIPANASPVTTANSFRNFEEINDIQNYNKVILYWDDENAFVAGTGTNEFIDMNIWANQAIANHIFNVLNVYTHKPFVAHGIYIDPAIEIGDTISIIGVNYVVFNNKINYGVNIVNDLSSPGETAIDNEIKYEGSFTKALKNKVTLGASYYGTSISRAKGIEIVRTDGQSEALFNSDVFAMRAKINNVMRDRIFFDPVSGDYVFDGVLSANILNALSAVVTPNLYAEQGDISELTVDHLLTSRRTRLFLLQDTSIDNYVEIQGRFIRWISAWVNFQGTVPLTEQLKNRAGQNLFWDRNITLATISPEGVPTLDGRRLVTQTTVTDWPVIVYQYSPSVKQSMAFELDPATGLWEPVSVYGAGTGATTDAGKGKIHKSGTGFDLTYRTGDGQRTAGVFMRDDGFVDVTARRANIVIDRPVKKIFISPEGTAQTTFAIDYLEIGNTLRLIWPDSSIFNVELI